MEIWNQLNSLVSERCADVQVHQNSVLYPSFRIIFYQALAIQNVVEAAMIDGVDPNNFLDHLMHKTKSRNVGGLVRKYGYLVWPEMYLLVSEESDK